MSLQFGILGPLLVTHDAKPLQLGGRKQRRVLAVLVLRANQTVSIDRLTEDVWDENEPIDPAHVLQVYISNLRKIMRQASGEGWISTRPSGYLLEVDDDEFDAVKFEAQALRGRQDLQAGALREAIDALTAGLSLWRGEVLEDFAYESFVRPDALRLEEARLNAVEDLAEARLLAGEHRDLVPELEAVLSNHAGRERLVGTMMTALYQEGRHADALAEFERYRLHLAEDSGLDPSPGLVDLQRRILVRDEDPASDPTPIGQASARDLSHHRLKGFEEPVRLFRLASERLPPMKTIPEGNLPRPASSFIGREREVHDVAALFGNGARLVTLTGPGGSGKTRLAIEAATGMVGDYEAGALWVDLAPLRDPELVTGEIAKAIGAADNIAAFIAEREMLLLLDNLEQVIEVAPTLADVLEACPNLRMLVTSRERLRVRGEIEFPVAPLAAPEGVELFLARAGLQHSDESIRDLCRNLDDMPLAIELAAARTSLLTPAQILERLSERLDLFEGGRDADPRQRTLRSTMEWSHELLGEGERHLFARLAVFADGWTLESAERVAAATISTLGSLVDKSLIHRTHDRFWMLETVREYALERLVDTGEADVTRRLHAEYFLELSERAERHLIHEALGRLGAWHERMESELDNVRVALDCFEADGDGERACRLAGALAWFWEQRGQFAEGRRRVESAIGTQKYPTAGRASALSAAAFLAAQTGDLEAATSRAKEALALHRELGDPWRIADAVHALGYAQAEAGNLIVAREHFEEAVMLLHEVGDEDYAMWATRSLGSTYQDAGELGRAREIHEENLRNARKLGNAGVEATTLAILGTILTDQGDAGAAFPLLQAAYALHRELGESLEVATDLCRLAAALDAVGKREKAVELSSLSDALREELGARVPWVERLAERAIASVRDQLDPSLFEQAWERGKRLSPDAAVEKALSRFQR